MVLLAALWPVAALLLAAAGGAGPAAAQDVLPPCSMRPGNVYCLLKPVNDTLPWCMTCVRPGGSACATVSSGAAVRRLLPAVHGALPAHGPVQADALLCSLAQHTLASAPAGG